MKLKELATKLDEKNKELKDVRKLLEAKTPTCKLTIKSYEPFTTAKTARPEALAVIEVTHQKLIRSILSQHLAKLEEETKVIRDALLKEVGHEDTPNMDGAGMHGEAESLF